MSVMSVDQGFNSPGRIVTITNPYTEISMHQAVDLEVQGKYKEALEIYDRVLEMDPREARAHHAKGDIYDLMGRYNDAVTCYSKALECDPFNAETWYNKGVTLRKMGCTDEGDECMMQGVSQAL